MSRDFPSMFFDRRWRWRRWAVCVEERGSNSQNGEGGEVAWGGSSIPHDVAHVETCGKAISKTGVRKAKLGHLVLELSVGHSRGVAVDDAEEGLGDFLGGGVTVNRCCIEHQVLACVVPLFCLVLLPCILLLDVI